MMSAIVASPTQTQNKRKVSAAGLATGGRNVKRRASKACHCCRSRKVRCDVVESGIPCTNCRLDEVECLVTEGKRRRKSYIDGELLNHSPPLPAEDDNDLPPFPVFDGIDALNNISLIVDGKGASLSSPGDPLSQHTPHMLYQTQGHRMSQEEVIQRMSVIGITKPALLTPGLPSNMPQYFPTQNGASSIVLPKYIRPVPQRIMNEDLRYLQEREAFLVPETGLRNELLRCYAQYVHPYLPLLNLQDFLATIEKNDPSDTLSLLLFQSVMFAGSGFIDMRYLIAQGYDTRKAARRAFFQRAKLLYDFDYEVDRVTVVQAVLLMTYWYEAPDDPKDIWHWLGIAISLARTIGINCDTSSSSLDLKTRKLWKRIWWSCYLRDRLISLGMRRPMKISDNDYDILMLEVEDFETEAMPLDLSRMLGGCPAVKDASKRVTLAKMCISLVKLCGCVSQVLKVQYSLTAPKIGLTQETTVRLVPKQCPADSVDVIRCDRALEAWHKSTSPELQYFVPGSQERTNTNDGEVISLHRSLLTGVYLTAVSALHRPQILPTSPGVAIGPELQELSRRKVREAANDITEMYKDLYSHDMIRYLPNTGVSIILPALIIHMLDLKSEDGSIRQASARKFQFCMQALQRLREMYASADHAFLILDASVRKANVQIPASPMLVKQTVTDEAITHNSPTMLTPPPEAAWTVKQFLFASTLAPEEKKLLAAFTPPNSDHSYASGLYAGGAIVLADMAMSDMDDESSRQSEEEEQARLMEQQAENDFDALINMEGNGDLMNTDKGIYAEMNMAWLNGMETDNEHEQDYHEDELVENKSSEDSNTSVFDQDDENKVENGGYEERSKHEVTGGS